MRLRDRTVLDTGEVALDHDALVELALDGRPLGGLLAAADPRVDRYNRLSTGRIRTWTDDGRPVGPPPESYGWTTPEPWASADPADACIARLESLGLHTDAAYVGRLEREVIEMESRGMLPVLRHTMYLVDHWRKRGVAWGVGRGSSCASLVLYLLGLNLIDPIKHGIPMEEFLR
jgi:hypothetical protein